MESISELLVSARAGGLEAANRVFELLYNDLRALARAQLNRNSDRAHLDTTALVNESYTRMLGSGEVKAEDRRHFLAYASTAMRSIIVDFSRRHLAEKRGGGAAPVRLNTDLANSLTATDEEVLHLHDALARLSVLDERQAKIVEMRYFGGLTESETAEALGLSVRTVSREWEKARMFLAAELSPT